MKKQLEKRYLEFGKLLMDQTDDLRKTAKSLMKLRDLCYSAASVKEYMISAGLCGKRADGVTAEDM